MFTELKEIMHKESKIYIIIIWYQTENNNEEIEIIFLKKGNSGLEKYND